MMFNVTFDNISVIFDVVSSMIKRNNKHTEQFDTINNSDDFTFFITFLHWFWGSIINVERFVQGLDIFTKSRNQIL